MAEFLDDILKHKYAEVAEASARVPLEALEKRLEDASPPLDFFGALQQPRLPGPVSLIAEIKKASPSKGLIAPDFDAQRLAVAYAEAGASAMSVLTDEKFFQGHLDYLIQAKQAAGGQIPVLRKDFMVDSYQVWQARAYGADAILLIMAALEDGVAAELFDLATELGMAVLVEVHNEPELERALALGANIIGVNNRNLHTFEVDLATTERLVAKIPAATPKLVVSESGIGTREDIEWLASLGVRAVLIGETLMRAATTPQGLDTAGIGRKVREMFGG